MENEQEWEWMNRIVSNDRVVGQNIVVVLIVLAFWRLALRFRLLGTWTWTGIFLVIQIQPKMTDDDGRWPLPAKVTRYRKVADDVFGHQGSTVNSSVHMNEKWKENWEFHSRNFRGKTNNCRGQFEVLSLAHLTKSFVLVPIDETSNSN